MHVLFAYLVLRKRETLQVKHAGSQGRTTHCMYITLTLCLTYYLNKLLLAFISNSVHFLSFGMCYSLSNGSFLLHSCII